ncbi:MAG: hypothetical protein RLZZ562_933 [Planctomycetota bacterium]|jgi:hypothetical protein
MRTAPWWAIAALAAHVAFASCSSQGNDAPADAGNEAGAAVDLPPIHASFLADGSLRIVLTVPTGGHSFAVKSVESDGATAKVICAHEAPPADAIVTQVVTEHAALVESQRIPADAQEVTIWLSTKGRDGSTSLHESCKVAR